MPAKGSPPAIRGSSVAAAPVAGRAGTEEPREFLSMNRYAVTFLLLALFAAVLAFAALSGVAALLARVLLGAFLVLAVASIFGRRTG